MSRRSLRLVLVAAAAALTLAACGSSSKSGSGSTPTTGAPETTTTEGSPTTTAAASGGGAVSLAMNAKIGKNILVDAQGMTLYLYDKDTATKSNCNDGCATAWPPETPTANATYGAGIDASKFTTITRDDGTKQLAYNGHPLYHWVNDKAAGDATGQGINDFYVVGANGAKIDNS